MMTRQQKRKLERELKKASKRNNSRTYDFDSMFGKLKLTLGGQSLLNQCQCHWFFDDILLFQKELKKKGTKQEWLAQRVRDTDSFNLICTNPDTNEILFRHRNNLGDWCPLNEMRVIKIGDKLMLQSEQSIAA